MSLPCSIYGYQGEPRRLVVDITTTFENVKSATKQDCPVCLLLTQIIAQQGSTDFQEGEVTWKYREGMLLCKKPDCEEVTYEVFLSPTMSQFPQHLSTIQTFCSISTIDYGRPEIITLPYIPSLVDLNPL